MSLKAELETWSAALEAYDFTPPDLSLALNHFGRIAETSKIEWNIGIILATLGRHGEAVKRFESATALDEYLAVGWFQAGVSRFVSGLRTDRRWGGLWGCIACMRGFDSRVGWWREEISVGGKEPEEAERTGGALAEKEESKGNMGAAMGSRIV